MDRFVISGFADEIAPDLKTQMDVMEKLGIRHIEMRAVDGKNLCDCTLEEARSIKARMDARGFALSAVGSPIGKIGAGDPFGEHLGKFRHALDLAELFGTKYIRMFSFFIPKGEDPAQYRGAVLERWGQFIEAAKGRGVVLLHENEKGIYGDTPERCLDLLEALDCPYVRATFDPANFIQCGAKVYPEAYELLRPYIEYLHVKDAHAVDGRVTPAGEGDGHVPELIAALWESGFSGFLSLEPHLCDFSGFSSLEQGADKEGKAPETEGERLFTVAAKALFGILENVTKE